MTDLDNASFPRNDLTIMWLNSLKASSRTAYVKRLEDFHSFHTGPNARGTAFESFRSYMCKLHDEEVPASTLWNVYSIIGKYWKTQYNQDLDNVGKTVSGIIKQWSKGEVIRKAMVGNLSAKSFP